MCASVLSAQWVAHLDGYLCCASLKFAMRTKMNKKARADRKENCEKERKLLMKGFMMIDMVNA
jgi:hypothetical protein